MPARPPQNHPVQITPYVWKVNTRAKSVAHEQKIRIHGIYGRPVFYVAATADTNDFRSWRRHFTALQSSHFSRACVDH